MKIAVITRDDRQAADIAKMLRSRNPDDEVNLINGGFERLATIGDTDLPDVLILERPSIGDGDLLRVERLGSLHPRLAFILFSVDLTPDFLLHAMRAGVREVLPYPAGAATLLPAIERIEDKLDSRAHAHGKVLAFISCKGGSGATFIATNLGYALAASGAKRVALIDLNLQFGDASLFVSEQKPLATLSDVSLQIHRLDPSFLASSMLNIAPNYGVLAAPEDPAHANDVQPDHIDAILRLARRHYDFILLDVGRSLDAVSVRAMDQADMIFPVLQTTLPYIRDGKRLLGVFRSLDYARDKIHLLVNRHDKGGEIRLQDLEQAYGTSIYRTVPNHYDAAAASVNQGVPILKLSPLSPISRSLQEFAAGLSGETATAEPSLLTRLFKRA